MTEATKHLETTLLDLLMKANSSMRTTWVVRRLLVDKGMTVSEGRVRKALSNLEERGVVDSGHGFGKRHWRALTGDEICDLAGRRKLGELRDAARHELDKRFPELAIGAGRNHSIEIDPLKLSALLNRKTQQQKDRDLMLEMAVQRD